MRWPPISTLPEKWHERDVVVVEWSGCWIWVGTTLTWQVARGLIARERRVPTDSGCAVTAACVHPYHSRNTRRPGGGHE